jgi:O-antigen ligase
LAAAATLGIASRGPFVAWGYEAGIFLYAAAAALTARFWTGAWEARLWIPLAGIALWGFAQLAAGATVYRWGTFDAALRYASYAATALMARFALSRPAVRAGFLRAFAWFGFALAACSTLAYFTSRSKILWLFPSPYPDVWGPFLSRNNFAQFLELALPAALWLGFREPTPAAARLYLAMAAAMLAAGIASASRAGAILLLAETAAVFLLRRRAGRARCAWFAWTALAFIAVAGAGTLLGRFADSDPLRYRREIFQSALHMIDARPGQGFGLGAWAAAYPQFARFDSGAAVEHAHNDWLEWAGEGGLGFALLWVAFALASCRPAIRSVWGIGLAALFLHALVDYPFARPGVAVWAFIFAGALRLRKPALQRY